MFKPVEIRKELAKERKRLLDAGEILLHDARKILYDDQFTEKNILDNLKSYNKSFGLLDEEEIDKDLVFTKTEIKNICTRYRLRFLDSDVYTGEFPYESILKIKDLNTSQRKDLKHFKVIATAGTLKNPALNEDMLLFCETVYGNYYLIHRWGKPLPLSRKWNYLFIRNFETMLLFTLLSAVILTLITPTKLMTNDPRAEFFSMYRSALFFHILIINTGFVVFYLFKKNIPFSSSCWDSKELR
jgi:hypothetical protein